MAKGCNTCHANTDLTERPANETYAVGPDLGGRRLDRQSVIAKMIGPASERMPALGLREDEVQALAAFLNGGRAVGAAGGGRR
ncbi:MAG: cytochrome c [Gemmatimonadales bacterium]|nr:cytochrome c [Gemmatimonadales bacterium]